VKTKTPKAVITRSPVSDLLRLRILVLALGEAHHAGWWKSHFLSPTGLSYLERLYPRSSFAAAVRSASRTARPVHDSSLGVGAVFHLFRLPEEQEEHLDALLRTESDDLKAEFAPMLAHREQLLEALGKLSQTDAKLPSPVRGPVRLGTLAGLQSGAWCASCAALYAAAFGDGTKVFPYIEVPKP
jgi:hypothetical protein